MKKATYGKHVTKKVLLKDIVIPAGTVFTTAPEKIQMNPGEHVECIVGLTKNTAGSLIYQISDELGEWFADA